MCDSSWTHTSTPLCSIMPSLLREFLTNMEGDDQFVLPHQHEAASFLVSGFLERAHRGRILNDSVGMGKTRSTLLAVAFLMVHWERLPEELRGGNSVPHVMVVARRDLLNQWQDEWNAILARVRDALGHPTQEEHRLTILKSNENKRQIIAPLCYPAGHIVLQGTTYQSLGHRLSPYMDRRYPWTLVLADEAHAIKNPRTAMFKTMESAVTDYRVLLTGTVVSNDLRDLWAPLNLVHHPDTFPWKSWGIFKRAIVKPLQDRIVNCGRRHKKQLGAHEDLQCAMRQVTLRQESEAVGSSFDLHSTRVIMALPLTTQQSEQMVRAIQPYRGSREHSLEQDKRGILHLTTRLRIISQCSALGSADSVDAFRAEDLSTSTAEGLQEASNKTSFAVRFLRSLLEDPVHPRKHHRVVVVSPYTSYLETLAKCLRTLQGVRLHMAHGGMSVADRTEQLEPFVKRAGGAQRPSRGGKDWEVDREGSEGSSSRGNRSSSLSVLLLSTHVGSEGLNLSRCDILLNMSPTWKVSDLRQVEGRLLRRGQENADVLVVHLICAENSLEETIMCRHSFKQAQDTMVSSMTRRGSSSSSNQRTSFSFTREEIRRILSFEADGLFKEASFLAKRRPDALVGKDKYNAWHQRLLACCEPQPAWLFDTDQLLSPAPGTFKVPETEGPKPVIKSSKPKPQDIKPKLKTASAPPPRVSSSLTGAARPWVERPRVEKRRPWSWKDCSLFPPRKRLACEAQWNEEQDEAPQWKRPEVIRQGEIKPPQQWQPPQRADNQPQQQAVNQQQQPASFLHLERLHGPEVSMMETASFFRPRELGAVPFSM